MATLLESPTHRPPRFALDAAADTFPKLLRRNAGVFDDRIAFREKDMGVWRPITWREYYRHARERDAVVEQDRKSTRLNSSH